MILLIYRVYITYTSTLHQQLSSDAFPLHQNDEVYCSQAGSSNGSAGEAAKQSARVEAVIGLLVSMGAELQTQPENVPGSSGAAPADCESTSAGGSMEEDDDDFDTFEEAAEQLSESSASSTSAALPAESTAGSVSAADAHPSVSAGQEDKSEHPSVLAGQEIGSDHLLGGQGAPDRPKSHNSDRREAHAAENGVSEGGSRGEPGSSAGPAAAEQHQASSHGSAVNPGSNGVRASAEWAARERCLRVRSTPSLDALCS